MAIARMPDEFFETVAHHLPPEQPVGPEGGRPRVGHRIVLRVIWFVLATGARWEDVPPELGCSGRTAHRRLRAWEEAGVWDRLHADLLAALKRAGKLDLDTVIIDGVTVRAFGGGEATGPAALDPNGCDQLEGPVLDINDRIDPAVDLLVTAHTHQAYNCLLPVAGGEPRLVTQAGFYGRLVTDIRLTLDADTGDVDGFDGYDPYAAGSDGGFAAGGGGYDAGPPPLPPSSDAPF